VLGHHLLTLGDPEGLRLLEQVVGQADESWMRPACEALQAHFRATGQPDRLGEIRSRLDRHEKEVAEAQRERATIRASDSFRSHDLAPEQIEPLWRLLITQPDCGAAWLVRKELRYFPRRPLFVLCVRRDSARWWLKQPDRDRDLVRQISPKIELPGQVLVIAPYGPYSGLARKVMALPGAEVFRRNRPDLPSSVILTGG
jgi:hypothetical protein